MSEKRTHTEVLFDLIGRWQEGEVSNQVLIRDLSGMAANTDHLEADKTALGQRLEHFERFKLYLKTMGGIDVDHAWEATAAEEELINET